MRYEQQTERQFDLLQCIIDTSPLGIVILDENCVVKFWNPAAESIFEISAADAIDTAVESLLAVDTIGADEKTTVRFAEMQTARQSGSAIQIEPAAHRIQIEDQVWTIVYINDVTVIRENERRLANEAMTDPLSGLANRRGFQVKLESAISKKLTLAIIDVDNFKRINDRFGHEAGDLAIQHVATQLEECFPDAISCSRLGGDEFGIVLETCSQQEVESKFEQLRQIITTSKLAQFDLSLTVSIGVAISNVSGTSARELLTTADRCMYASKKAGRNQISTEPIND